MQLFWIRSTRKDCVLGHPQDQATKVHWPVLAELLQQEQEVLFAPSLHTYCLSAKFSPGLQTISHLSADLIGMKILMASRMDLLANLVQMEWKICCSMCQPLYVRRETGIHKVSRLTACEISALPQKERLRCFFERQTGIWQTPFAQYLIESLSHLPKDECLVSPPW